MTRSSYVALFLCIAGSAFAAPPDGSSRHWVFFRDKQLADDQAVARAMTDQQAALSAKTQARRAARRIAPGILDERDLPVAAEYIAAIRNTGTQVRFESRWINAVSVTATADQLRAIDALPFVERTQSLARAARRIPMPVEPAPVEFSTPRGADPSAFYGPSYPQLLQINAVAAHNAGYTGQGVIVGILDTGFNRTHVAFNQTVNAHPVQIIDEYDFIVGDFNTAQEPSDPPNQSNHGTYILGTMAAYFPGTYVGAAYNASFVLAKTEDITQEIPDEEDAYVAGLEWIEAHGADMVTSSLGYIDWYTQADLNGLIAVTTTAVNVATENGLICCTAAGNEGNDTNPATSRLIAPADAFGVLTCGAVDLNGVIAWFSSDGPTADGRVKPELLARGVETMTTSAVTNNIIPVNGTSLATPLLAGGTALVIQAHPNWSPDKVRRAYFHTASGFSTAGQFDPLYVRGYGIINVFAAINFVHGDINNDGAANGLDIPRFIASLTGQNPDPSENRRSDTDASGQVNVADVPIFVADLLGS